MGSVHLPCTAIVVRSPSSQMPCRRLYASHGPSSISSGSHRSQHCLPFFSEMLTIEAADFDCHVSHNVLLLPLFLFLHHRTFLHLPMFAVCMPYPPRFCLAFLLEKKTVQNSRKLKCIRHLLHSFAAWATSCDFRNCCFSQLTWHKCISWFYKTELVCSQIWAAVPNDLSAASEKYVQCCGHIVSLISAGDGSAFFATVGLLSFGLWVICLAWAICVDRHYRRE